MSGFCLNRGFRQIGLRYTLRSAVGKSHTVSSGSSKSSDDLTLKSNPYWLTTERTVSVIHSSFLIYGDVITSLINFYTLTSSDLPIIHVSGYLSSFKAASRLIKFPSLSI